MRVKICDGLLTYCLRLFVGSLKMKMEMSKLQVFCSFGTDLQSLNFFLAFMFLFFLSLFLRIHLSHDLLSILCIISLLQLNS